MMMLIRTSEVPFMKKSSSTVAESEKTVAYKKACSLWANFYPYFTDIRRA